MTRLRIALTHAYCWPEVRRGGERYLHELAGALARRGHAVTIFGGAPSWGLSRADGVRMVRTGRGRPSDAWKLESGFARRVGIVLTASHYDVVHSLGPMDAVASIRARRIHRSRRTVYTCLGLPIRASWERRPDGSAQRSVVEEIDVYGCLSRFAQRCLRTEYGRDGALTPGGVRLDTFQPSAARAKTPTLLYSGALDESRKGLPVLLRAVARLAREEPSLRLWLSGPGDPSAILAQAPSEARDRTEILGVGRLEDQPEIYSAAWATVLPSTNEAFGLVLVESLACGTPIVVADHSSLPELVDPGVGIAVQPDLPEALAEACKLALALAADPQTRERCRESARRHDWDTSVAPATESLYLGTERDRSI